MTTPHVTSSLRHVVEAATLAPSVHNTQPWRFVLRPDGFDLLADPARRLEVLDPTGRLLHLSCGAALATARVAARALGLTATAELEPDPDQTDLLARLTLSAGDPPDDDEMALALAVLKRHTVRQRFDSTPVPEELVRSLCQAAEREGAALRPVRDPGELVSLAGLLSAADRREERDPAYREELTSWVRTSPEGDGIPPEAVAADPAQASSLRLRDFTLSHPERGGGDAPEVDDPAVLVLTTSRDEPADWLRAGQALAVVLLHAAAQGVQVQPLGQVVDLTGPRAALARALGLTGVPQLVLRMGYVTSHAQTPRRDVADVLAE